MNRLAIILPLLVLLSFTAYTQDRLHLRNGKVEEVKVKEITDKNIRYLLFDNLDGPEYVIDKSKVDKIVYENGQVKRYGDFPTSTGREKEREKREDKPKKRIEDYGRHFIGFNLSDMIRTDVCLHYEYLFADDHLALRIPLLIGFNNNYFNVKSTVQNAFVFRRNRIFETGIDLRYYPGRQGVVRYVMGPGLHYILNNKRGPLTPSGPVGNHPVNTIRWLIYNGIVFTPTKHFRFGLDLGLGSQYDLSDTKYTEIRVFGDPKVQFNFYMGAKF